MRTDTLGVMKRLAIGFPASLTELVVDQQAGSCFVQIHVLRSLAGTLDELFQTGVAVGLDACSQRGCSTAGSNQRYIHREGAGWRLALRQQLLLQCFLAFLQAGILFFLSRQLLFPLDALCLQLVDQRFTVLGQLLINAAFLLGLRIGGFGLPRHLLFLGQLGLQSRFPLCQQGLVLCLLGTGLFQLLVQVLNLLLQFAQLAAGVVGRDEGARPVVRLVVEGAVVPQRQLPADLQDFQPLGKADGRVSLVGGLVATLA